MDILHQAEVKNIISFDEERKYITYVHQNKKSNFYNSEIKVQAEAFSKLVIKYNYPVKRIRLEVPIQTAQTNKIADIVVYSDDECAKPFILIECKSPNVSELEFKESVKQAQNLANTRTGATIKYIWITKGNRNEYYLFDDKTENPIVESNIPHYPETSVRKYSFARGGVYFEGENGDSVKVDTGDLRVVSENELTQIFKQSHDALWAGGELNPSQAFDELDKLIFCKVWDERTTKTGEPYKFQIYGSSKKANNKEENAKNLVDLRERINKLYDKGKEKDPEIFNKPIELSNERIKTVVEYFQEINFSDTDLDSKGKAFETFLGTYFRGEFGQYFTPRNIVKFAVEALPITNDDRVLDTSCGSGGFLLYVLDKIRRQADKAFPDYETNNKQYPNWYKYWHDFAEKNLYGIEINDQISRVAKMNMIIHDDGHTNVVTYDALFEAEQLAKVKNNPGFAENSFDYIVTNPPFGSIAKQSEKSYMQIDHTTAPYYDFALKEVNWIDAQLRDKHTATNRENQSTEVLFIEQAHHYLKEGGYLAVVIPDGILTNSSSQYIRNGIEEKFRIVAVVSLPQTAFTNTGAGVKSSILFLRKHQAEVTRKIKKQKKELAIQIGKENNLKETLESLEKEKRELTAPLKGKDEETQAQRKAIIEEYNEKISNFREELEETYLKAKQLTLEDYPIFMAIAENVGYDGGGKNIYRVLSKEESQDENGDKITIEVQENDLFTSQVRKTSRIIDGKEVEILSKEKIIDDKGIVGELKRFIESINEGTDSFFASALS